MTIIILYIVIIMTISTIMPNVIILDYYRTVWFTHFITAKISSKNYMQ